MDLTGGSYSYREEFMKEKYDAEFGTCDECGKVGVVLLNYHGEWVCHDCAYDIMQRPQMSESQVKKIDQAH